MFCRIAILFLFVLKLQAQNNLIIYNTEAKPFRVVSKQIHVSDTSYQEARFTGILADTIDIEIYSAENSSSFKSTIYLLEKGADTSNMEFVYAIENLSQTGKQKLNYITSYPISKPPNPLVPPKPFVDSTILLKDKVYGNLYEMVDRKPKFKSNIPINSDCKTPMQESDLNHGIVLLKKAQLNNDRLDIATQITNHNCISTAQLKQIATFIDYDIDKFKFIRTSRKHVTDKGNLNTLSDLFKIESIKKQYLDYLKTPEKEIESYDIVCTKAITDSVVNSIIKNVKLYSTDFDRYNFMKESNSGSCFRCEQFKRILNNFVHDREKLELIEIFYNNLVDKENINLFKDCFTYKESFNQLNQFINER